MRMPYQLGGYGLALALSAQALPARADGDVCAHIMPASDAMSHARRPLYPDDLVRLRDIGPDDRSFPDARLITLSPDRRKLAFQLRQADPDSNGYCLAMFIMDARPGSHPLMVDQGGELIRSTIDFRGKAGFPSGIPLTISPRWAPNGDWIAFLKRVGTTTQVWRADAAGRGSAPLTHSAFDIVDFRLAAGGRNIIFAGRPVLQEAREQIRREGLSGFHFDDRYAPASSNRPFPATPIPVETFVQDIATGRVRDATIVEARQLRLPLEAPEDAVAFSQSFTGRRAWLHSAPHDVFQTSLQLVADDGAGNLDLCTNAVCDGRIGRPWWTSDGTAVRYFRLEGPGYGTTSIYEWRPGGGAPSRLYSTQDVLADCESLDERLICVREDSTSPRHISILDPVSGRSELIFDPNPEFAALRLGSVERFSWKNSFGLETIGDLVLPVDYSAGKRYPLIVVQYDTRGFLRGGTGDEFPIQAFANRGYAVLSFSRPPSIGLVRNAQDGAAIGKANLRDFADRRSVQSSLEIAIHELVSRGIADPKRIGITGLSDGGTTAEFALLHSDLFAAAAMSSCCWDASLTTRVGPNAARHFIEEGYPRLSQDGSAFWNQLSLAANARKITAPILLQMADDEYMSALMGFTALREVGAPIDLYIFPDEHHVKWQPAHRLAVFRRSLDWFDYWLKGTRSESPDRSSELAHWDDLRLARSIGKPAL